MSDDFLKEYLKWERESFEENGKLKHGTNIDDLPTGKVVHKVKMKEVFPEAFQVEHNKSFEVQNLSWYSYGTKYESNSKQDSVIEYAVLNHDRLVEENEDLNHRVKDLTSCVNVSVSRNNELKQENAELREALQVVERTLGSIKRFGLNDYESHIYETAIKALNK